MSSVDLCGEWPHGGRRRRVLAHHQTHHSSFQNHFQGNEIKKKKIKIEKKRETTGRVYFYDSFLPLQRVPLRGFIVLMPIIINLG
jgi:hypothetical protein